MVEVDQRWRWVRTNPNRSGGTKRDGADRQFVATALIASRGARPGLIQTTADCVSKWEQMRAVVGVDWDGRKVVLRVGKAVDKDRKLSQNLRGVSPVREIVCEREYIWMPGSNSAGDCGDSTLMRRLRHEEETLHEEHDRRLLSPARRDGALRCRPHRAHLRLVNYSSPPLRLHSKPVLCIPLPLWIGPPADLAWRFYPRCHHVHSRHIHSANRTR